MGFKIMVKMVAALTKKSHSKAWKCEEVEKKKRTLNCYGELGFTNNQ